MGSQYKLFPTFRLGEAIRDKAKARLSRVLAVPGVVLLFVGLMTAQVPPPDLTYSPEELDNMVAPIALYPDNLLSQVLVASTYPLEVVEAQQWLQQSRGLTGEGLMNAARQQNWDPSIQALAAFPDVLTLLNRDIRWTTDLGNGFLGQQADVMSAVQRMRARAQANGRLRSNTEQTVTSQVQDGQTAIEIEPANPEVVYVPYYDPLYVWGGPAWGTYPTVWNPSTNGFGYWPGIYIGSYFGSWYGWGGWGWGPSWFGHTVIVNNLFFNRYGFHGYGGGENRGVWAHNPEHRAGVPYNNAQLSGRFNSASVASRINRFESSTSFRGGNSFQGGNRAPANNSFQGGNRPQGANTGGWQRFNGGNSGTPAGGSNSFLSPRVTVPPAQRYRAPARGYNPSVVPAHRVSAPTPRFSGPSSPRSFGGGGGGGGARSFDRGGGGGGRSFGGGAGARGGGRR